MKKWWWKAEYIETCNCAHACSCNLTMIPTDNTCQAIDAWKIKEGASNGTSLQGLASRSFCAGRIRFIAATVAQLYLLTNAPMKNSVRHCRKSAPVKWGPADHLKFLPPPTPSRPQCNSARLFLNARVAAAGSSWGKSRAHKLAPSTRTWTTPRPMRTWCYRAVLFGRTA